MGETSEPGRPGVHERRDPHVVVLADQLRRRPTSGIATYTRGLLAGLVAMGADAPLVTLAASKAPPGVDPLARWGFGVRSSRLPAPVLTRMWDRGMGAGVVGRGDMQGRVAEGSVVGGTSFVEGSSLVRRGSAAGGRAAGGSAAGGSAAGRPSVLHATSLACPYPNGVPVVCTVHDLAWREVPDAFPGRGRRWHEAALGRCLERAAVIVAPSERTGALLREAGAGSVVVIPEGCDHLAAADPMQADALLRSLGVVTPYLLTVSTIEPRKNLPRLLNAYDRARGRLPEPWPLLVVGPHGWGGSLRPTPGVKLAGVVSDAVLAALYAGARCMAYVPLVEGWGLPPVEAMAACTPVVASPMPSTAGAVIEVDPYDIDAIADALVVAAGEDRRRSELVTAGLLRAQELTWEAAARRHVDVWRSVHGSGG